MRHPRDNVSNRFFCQTEQFLWNLAESFIKSRTQSAKWLKKLLQFKNGGGIKYIYICHIYQRILMKFRKTIFKITSLKMASD